MQGPLVDFILIAVLVLFFGLQLRSRSELYLRFWFAGWVLIFVSFVLWEPTLADPKLIWFQELLRLEVLVLAGMAFILSFIVREGRLRQTMLFGLAATIPAVLGVGVSMLDRPPYWLLAVLILAGEGMVAAATVALLPARWSGRRAILVGASVVSAIVLLALCRWVDQGHDLSDWILAQIFLYAAFLYAGFSTPRTIAGLAGTLGFAAWGLAYGAAAALGNNPTLLRAFYGCWDLPKYSIAFGMALSFFEDSKRQAAQLADRYRLLYEDFRLLYMDHPHPMWIYNPVSLRFLSVNSAAMARYVYSQAEFLAMTVDEISAPPETSAAIVLLADGEERPYIPTLHRDRNGEILAVEVTDHEILYQGREARFVLAVDITEREKLNRELVYQAHHDSLTGLPNRLTLDDRILQCLARSVRENTRAVLFTIDVDRFKLINDTFGHMTGDECLKVIASRLQTRIRQVDTIARTGGEEFTAIIGGLKRLEDSEKIANSLRQLFEAPLNLSGHEVKISISIGGSIFPDDATEPDELRKKSDQALYHAKRTGRNRVVFASPEVCADFDLAAQIELALKHALTHDGFELVYQPIFSRSGAPAQFEALLRMKDLPGGPFEPTVFIPVAEESGLIVPIGQWTIHEVCRQLVALRALESNRSSGLRCCIAINVSGRELLQKSFAGDLLATLHEFGLPPESLQLELTETTLMTEHLRIVEGMMELAAAGLVFAIDDFGTGYSSLARLADLPISMLKIDRSFVAQLETTESANGIVTAIVQMAQTMRVEVVAEGIETAEQFGLLREMGCDHFQGFFLGRPCTPDEMMALLRDGTEPPLLQSQFAAS